MDPIPWYMLIMTKGPAPPSTSLSTSFPVLPFRPASQCQRRNATGGWFGYQGSGSEQSARPSPGGQGDKSSNPIINEYLQKKPSLQQNQVMPTRGQLSESNIFEEDDRARGGQREGEGKKRGRGERNVEAMNVTLDPSPVARRRWEAKMVAREIRRQGQMTKQEVIKQTERSHTNTSPMMKTSVKKLGMLARQIAGKTLDDAMTQMRFSVKKPAQGVLEHLQYARDSAVVVNGMNLGSADGVRHEPVTIRDKAGNRVKVVDPTNLYIDEAWVNRGPYRKKPEYRARGRTNVLRMPYTSLTVILKEEATRVRQHKEREEKQANKKVWTPMPDRPVTAQHQYPLW